LFYRIAGDLQVEIARQLSSLLFLASRIGFAVRIRRTAAVRVGNLDRYANGMTKAFGRLDDASANRSRKRDESRSCHSKLDHDYIPLPFFALADREYEGSLGRLKIPSNLNRVQNGGISMR
jgi:hypothetical protein